SLAQFSAAWKQTPEAERHKLLPWLVGQSARRHTVYPLQRTRLTGMNRQQVEAVLGTGSLLQFGRGERLLGPFESYYVLSYPIGSIEMDVIGAMIPGISKADYLMIELDQVGNVVRIETSS
ncbi:MAG: hypothetical protein IT442_07250, partial [Phycisphaeraceae bacterium]|nr:hypothetical protein [Phycisphaeraceae bacterium]